MYHVTSGIIDNYISNTPYIKMVYQHFPVTRIYHIRSLASNEINSSTWYDPINFLKYLWDKNERIKIKSNFVLVHFDDLLFVRTQS